MRTFKDDLYRDYMTTHVLPRKAAPSVAGFRKAAPSWRRMFSGLLPADKSAPILDAGCGTGSIVWWFQHEGFAAAEGVDLNPEAIAMAQALGVEHLHHGDVQTFLAERPNRYALIVLRDVLEHFRPEDVMQTLMRAREALLPGGRILIQVPNGQSPFFGTIRYGDFTHELAFAPSSMQQVLLATGFADVNIRGCPPAARGPRSWPRFLAWLVVERCYRFMLWAESGKRHAVVTQNLIATARRPITGP